MCVFQSHTPTHSKLFTPTTINHNSNWPPSIQLSPNPNNLALNLSFPSYPSHSHNMTYWAGFKLPPLSVSLHHYSSSCHLKKMNLHMSPCTVLSAHRWSSDLVDRQTGLIKMEISTPSEGRDFATDISTPHWLTNTYKPTRTYSTTLLKNVLPRSSLWVTVIRPLATTGISI